MSVFLREVKIKISEKDYLDFLKASNGYNLTIEEKILEIINYYVIIERKRMRLEKMKIRFKPLLQFRISNFLVIFGFVSYHNKGSLCHSLLSQQLMCL